MPVSKRKIAQKAAFSHKEIVALKCEQGKDFIDVVEGSGRDKGFGIRVYRSGKKVFYYKFRLEGKLKYMSLGEFPERVSVKDGNASLEEAHEAYRNARDLVRRRLDPRIKIGESSSISMGKGGEPESADTVTPPAGINKSSTVQQVIDNFIDITERRKGHSEDALKNNKYTFNASVPKAWKERPADSLTNDEILELLDSIARGRELGSTVVTKTPTPGQATNTLKALRTAWTYAKARKLVAENPFKDIILRHTIPEMIQKTRERFLPANDIGTIWQQLGSPPGSESVRRALKMILLSAQRPGEVAGMHRNEINGRWWTIPTERTKYQVGPYRVYLTDLALEVIGDNPGYIFPSPVRKYGEKPITRRALSNHLNLGDRDSKDWPMKRHYGLEDWHPQDLRHTVRTFLPELRVIDEYAEEIINHRKEGLVATYNIYKYDAEKEDAMQRWEQRLLKIINQGDHDDPPPSAEKRILSDSEIRTIWQGLTGSLASADATCRALKTVLLTGQAPGRCATLHHNDIVIDSGVRWWRDSGNGNKTYLTSTALQLIGPPEEGYAFASRGDHVKIGTLSYYILRVQSFGIPKWTPSDLQITTAAKIGELGASRKIVEAVEKGLTVNAWELKFWLEKWEEALLKLIQ